MPSSSPRRRAASDVGSANNSRTSLTRRAVDVDEASAHGIVGGITSSVATTVVVVFEAAPRSVQSWPLLSRSRTRT